MGIFADLSKPFDLVDHNLLLSKMQKYGVRGVTLELIKSYLTDRGQFLATEKHVSQHSLCITATGLYFEPLFSLGLY